MTEQSCLHESIAYQANLCACLLRTSLLLLVLMTMVQTHFRQSMEAKCLPHNSFQATGVGTPQIVNDREANELGQNAQSTNIYVNLLNIKQLNRTVRILHSIPVTPNQIHEGDTNIQPRITPQKFKSSPQNLQGVLT